MNSVEVIKGQGLVARRGNSQEFERQRVAAYCRVSTDNEDQLSSYKSQVQHYTEYIKSKNEWVFAGIYADAADIIGLNQNPITTGADLVLFFLFSAKNEANGGCDCLI